MVDGVKINVTVSEHPTAYVTQPMSTSSDRILGQSVHFIPNYLTMSQQPDDSYRLLIDSIDASPADLSLSDSFLVFDLSDAPTGKDAYTTTASPSFSVTGDPQQLRMLFVDGDCKISRVDKNYRDTGAGTASFYLTARSGRAAQKQWLALPEDDSAHALLVCVGGAAIPGRVMTLGEILTEAPGVDEEDQPAFLADLNRRLAGAPLDGSATLVDIEAGKPFDRVSSGGNSMVDLCQFAIDQPGEHTIAVTVDAPPESDCVSLPWYVYAASPASMWASVDERCATVQTRGGEYTYPIGDALFRFTPPPNQ